MTASTCLASFLISTPVPKTGTLHRGPVVCFLAYATTSDCISQPAFFSRRDAGITSYRDRLNLGSHYNRGGSEADSACNISVGSYDLLEFLARPIERPGHATATKGIRSKPVAPEGTKPLMDQLIKERNPACRCGASRTFYVGSTGWAT